MLREARAASALNHPNIVTLHDVGCEGGRPFLVMELVEGERFSALARRGLPWRQGFALCAQVADALAAAHRRGILHRDIKSDNLMRAADGRVKVLDFGVAKLMQVAPGGEADADADADAGRRRRRERRRRRRRDRRRRRPGRAGERCRRDGDGQRRDHAGAAGAGARHSAAAGRRGRRAAGDGRAPGRRGGRRRATALEIDPTLPAPPGPGRATLPLALAEALDPSPPPPPADDSGEPSPAPPDEWSGSGSPATQLTRLGDIIGTPAYMSPEQAGGEPVGPASEVFSLAIVAYELVAGVRPFAGRSVEEVLSSVRAARARPPSQTAPARRLPRAVDRVLARALAAAPADRYPDMASFAAALRRAAARGRGGWLLAAALAAAAVAAAALVLAGRGTPAPASDPLARLFTHPAVRRLTVAEGCEEFPTFSPDGNRLVFDGEAGGQYALFSLDLAGGAPRQLTHPDGWDFAPALSPDGRRLAFLRREQGDTHAYVTDADAASPPTRLAKGRTRPSWSPDGRALWAGAAEQPERFDVASGRPGRKLRAPPGLQILHLRELADGRVVAIPFPDDTAAGGNGVLLYPAEAGADSEPRWLWRERNEEVLALAPTGEVISARLAASGAMELWRIPLDGTAPAVVAGNAVAPRVGLAIAAAGDRVAWSDCDTEETLALLAAPAPGAPLRAIPMSRGAWADSEPAALPGGDLLVLSDRGGQLQIWEVDPDGRAAARAVPTPGLLPTATAASPDGALVAFSAEAKGLWVVPRDGSAPPRRVVEAATAFYPTFSRDGRTLVFEGNDERGQPTLFAVPLAGGPARRLVAGFAQEPAASPVADAIAYLEVTDPSGELGTPVLLDLASGQRTVITPALPAGWYHHLRFSPDGRRLALGRGGVEVLELSLPDGTVLRHFDAGTRQITGLAYRGDDLIVGLTGWKGDIWLAEAR